MFGWLFGDPWQDEPPLERKVRKRRRGPSWPAFWLAAVGLFTCGFVTGCNAMETQLHHIGLW